MDTLALPPNPKRATRRWQRQKRRARLIKRALGWGMDERHALAYARRRVDTRQPCSCGMCGHVRRHAGPTRQERLARRIEQEGLQEWLGKTGVRWT